MKDIDSEIKVYQKKLRLLKPYADRLRNNLIKETARFIGSWYDATVRSYLTQFPAQVEQLGEGKLKQMKEEVASLIAQASDIARQELSDQRMWWPFDDTLVSLDEQEYLDVDDALRFSLGRVFPVLRKYGYLSEPSEIHQWAKYDRIVNATKNRYPHDIQLPKKIIALISRYKKLFMRACPLATKLLQLARAKRRQQAEGLWDAV